MEQRRVVDGRPVACDEAATHLCAFHTLLAGQARPIFFSRAHWACDAIVSRACRVTRCVRRAPGQLTVFANRAWARDLFRSAEGWRAAFADPRRGAHAFFDERAFGARALATRADARRVAFVVGQLSDGHHCLDAAAPPPPREGGGDGAKEAEPRAGGGRRPARPPRRVVWRGGRVLRLGGRDAGGDRDGGCVDSEAALVHLVQMKQALSLGYRSRFGSDAAPVDESVFSEVGLEYMMKHGDDELELELEFPGTRPWRARPLADGNSASELRSCMQRHDASGGGAASETAAIAGYAAAGSPRIWK